MEPTAYHASSSRRVVALHKGSALTLAAMIILTTASSVAAATAPTPVLDGAPEAVRFKASASIHGHLEGGAPGDVVVLERKGLDMAWDAIDQQPVGEDLTVTFTLSEVRRTAAYRLMYGGSAEATTTSESATSESATIRMLPVPRLRRVPRVVGFHGKARVRARLAGGRTGQRIRLERRFSGRDWNVIQFRRVNDELRATFTVRDLEKSARYRVTRKDRVTGRVTKSERARVRVRPKLTVHARRHVMADNRVVVRGRLQPRVRGRRVVVRSRVGGQWWVIDRPRAGDGTYRTSFRPQQSGRRRVRVTFRGDEFNVSKSRARPMWVYRSALATWYGPGFYGNRTACGQTYTQDILGVAHRTLPCGTRVSILYRGRTVTVPVIDRGPYGEADFDLSYATARQLDFSGKDYIGVIP
jgi:hypothetical protein